jgi:lysophospholipase L1-like esterase
VPRRSRGRLTAGLSAVLALLVLASCANPANGAGIPTPSITPGAEYYVSIGDSYAAGYQPSASDQGATTLNGFAYQVADQAKASGRPVQLMNFGCSGATSVKIVSQAGCEAGALGPGGVPYPDQAQAVAAVNFVAAHRDSIALVTVVMGGNDVNPCLAATDPPTCVEEAIPVLRRNVDGLLQAIRAEVGDSVPIIGLTYPDVYLGAYLKGDEASKKLADNSRTLFKNYLNPALAAAYSARHAKFVDITTASGAYDTMNERVDVPPYGSIPTPVARVCELTFYCQYQDVHPTNAGYTFIADAVVKAVNG